jgi:hypothetical protein
MTMIHLSKQMPRQSQGVIDRDLTSYDNGGEGGTQFFESARICVTKIAALGG